MATEDANTADLQPPPELRAQWKKPFKEQVDFFRQKLNMPTQHYDDVRGNQHDKAFVVAGAQKAELLTDFRKAVDRIQSEGQTLDWFQKNFDKIVADHGWQHTGDRRWRAKVIYQGNMLSTYGAGREKQLQDPELQKLRPYRTRRHSHTSANPRRLHLSWDGITLAHDDPWVQSHPCPGGYGCHCRWTAASRAAYREAQANGKAQGPDDGTYEFTDRWGEVHVLPKGVDYGWSHTPGATWQPDLKRYPKPIADDLEAELAKKKAAEEAARKAAEELAKKKATEEAARQTKVWHKRIEDEVAQARQRPEIARLAADHDKFVQAVQNAVARGETRSVGQLNASVQKAMGAASADIQLSDADVVRCALHGYKLADAQTSLRNMFSTIKLAVQDGNTLHVCSQSTAGVWQMATLEAAEGGQVMLKMLAGTTQREALALAKLGKPLLNKVPDLPPLTDAEFVQAGAQITQSMPVLDPRYPQDWHAELYRRMRLLGRLGSGSKNLVTPTAEATMATRMYPQAWVDVSDGLGKVHSRVSATGRGYAWTAHVDSAIPDTLTEFLDLQQAKKGEGVITHCAGDVGTAIHEYAHRLQTAIPGLDRLFQRLHLGRVSKDPIEQLKTITGNTGYKDDEVTRKDHYVNPYQGKEYAVKDGKALPGGALEVITMAMEAVVGGNALKPSRTIAGKLTLSDSRDELRNLYARDREVLDLVVGALLHFKP